MTRQHNNRGQQINIETVQGNVVVQKSTRSNAEWTLLQEVDREVESRLDQSLHNAALINLGKRAQPEQVKRIWDAEVKIGAKPPEPLPPDVGILDVFERSDIAGKLLILGDPGAGKTTTMLELAQALLDKAKQDADYPIPVVIALSGWQESNQSMTRWLADKLWNYGVGKDTAKQLLKEKRLLPLLDGLDEVKPEHQEACVQAINQWLQSDSRPVSVVVCSRREEYASYQTQLHLNGAILLQALTDEQIQDYLIQVNRPELWQVLQQDLVLLDLMKTPLLLSITVLSYETLSLQQWHQLTSTQERLNLLLDAYIQTMLHRNLQDPTMLKRGWLSKSYRRCKPPTAAQTRHWLTFLAQQLQRESQTEFLIERMQPNWIQYNAEKKGYLSRSFSTNGLTLILIDLFVLTASLITAGGDFFDDFYKQKIECIYRVHWAWKLIGNSLVFALFFSLGSGLTFTLNTDFPSFLIFGLITSCLVKLLLNIAARNRWADIPLDEVAQTPWIRLIWSRGFFPFLLAATLTGLILGLISKIWVSSFLWLSIVLEGPNWLSNALGIAIEASLSDTLSFSLMIGLIIGLAGLLHFSEPEQTTFSNQGIWNSARNSTIISLFFGIAFGLIARSVFGQNAGLIFGLTTALIMWHEFGGRAYIQHFILRLMLYRNRSIPWNYARFLNYCTERLFLQRVGGRYRFVHKLLQERFAELGNREIGENGKENE